MSGIYIKGMDMPMKGEYTATVYVTVDGYAFLDVWLDADNNLTCDLVPVPPHGRLIDADALIKAIVNTPSAVQNKDIPLVNQYDGATFRQIEILGMIENAPTIIPAEEGKT